MKKSETIAALNSYKKGVEQLRKLSPDWKPIPLKEYVKRYYNVAGRKV